MEFAIDLMLALYAGLVSIAMIGAGVGTQESGPAIAGTLALILVLVKVAFLFGMRVTFGS